MPDAVCIKAGGIDDKAVRDFKATGVEFYCKDRMAYSKAVEGAEQKAVSLGFFWLFCYWFLLLFLLLFFLFSVLFFVGFLEGGGRREEVGRVGRG